MRTNGIQRQLEMARRSASEWPEHKVEEARKIFRETATILDDSQMTNKPSTQPENSSALRRFRYAVEVKAVNRDGVPIVLHRVGGGGRLSLDRDYYPTVLWTTERNHRHFDPSDDPWGSCGGPYTVDQVLTYHVSDDPLGASVRGFASECTEEARDAA